MPKKILSWCLIVLVVVFAFLSWYSLDRAIFAEGASDFLVPLVWFSFFVVALSLLIVLVTEKRWVRLTALFSLALSFVFVHNFFHLAVVLVAWAFVLVAMRNINNDISSSLRISLTKSLHRGIFMIVMALGLMISGQYYFSVKDLNPANIAPSISKQGMASEIIGLVLPRISPEFKQVESDEINTDEFLGEIYETIIKREGEEIKNRLESGADGIQNEQTQKIIEDELGRELTADEKNQLKMLGNEIPSKVPTVSPQIKQEVLQEWKKELSKNVGFEVTGQEKVVDIFVIIVNSKIGELVELKPGEKKSTVLPLMFAMILFLTLIPVGSLASRIWTVMAAGIFWILRKAGLIRVEMETKEAEVIR